MVPTFYDSIEISRDAAVAKFRRRAASRHVVVAFLLTFVEAILTLIFVRYIYRMLKKLVLLLTGRGKRARALGGQV